MNFGKPLDISKSSLFSLKAELVRKTQEAKNNRASEFNRESQLKNKATSSKRKKNKIKKLPEKTEINEEQNEALLRSRSVLEAKSRLYSELSEGKLVIEDGAKRNYLVNFSEKSAKSVDDSLQNEHESDEEFYDSEEEVEYRDEFGRTKSCLRKDLNGKLSEVAAKEKAETTTPKSNIDTKMAESEDENLELMSADMRREMMRQKWEEQEKSLSGKKDIHYQDVLFDEARSHGTGYFAFSVDEERRLAQQEALAQLRRETEQQQKAVADAKQKRQAMMEARLEAAKRRKCEMLGLPPDDVELPAIDNSTDVKIPRIVDETKRKKEEEEKLKADIEKEVQEHLLQIQRSMHVRPWDVGKDGINAPLMSNEEWIETQRTERVEEFAPPKEYLEDVANSKKRFNYFSSKKKSNSIIAQQPKPIVTDESDNEEGNADITSKSREIFKKKGDPDISDNPKSSTRCSEGVTRGKGVEIAPPSTYGTSDVPRLPGVKSTKMSEAIEAGLNFQRKEELNRLMKKDKAWTDVL